MSPASPQKNSTFSTPLSAAFSLAFSTAAEMISAPMTFLPCPPWSGVMVPAPQYRSSTSSVPVRAAYFTALRYSTSAWSRFTW